MAPIHVADRDQRDYVGYVHGRMERLRSTSYPCPVDRRDRARARDFHPGRLNPLLALIAEQTPTAPYPVDGPIVGVFRSILSYREKRSTQERE